MSSLFSHVFIPLVIMLVFSRRLGLDTRMVIALGVLAVLPDADALFLVHRASLHNVFILIIPLLLFILTKNRNAAIGFFYLASHLVLDLFNGGVFLFYPLYDNVFFARAEFWFTGGGFRHVLEYGISRSVINTGGGEPVISSENIGVAALLIIMALIAVIRDRQKKGKKSIYDNA